MPRLSEKLSRLLGDFAGVLFPDVCVVCGDTLVRGEKVLCLKCLADLPLTHIHSAQFNPLHERVLSTSLPVDRAAAMMWYFRESAFAAIIHDAKYRARPSVGRQMARMYARMIAPDGFFDGIDLIVPVPVHFTRLLTRGYNQAEAIAEGLADITGIEVDDPLRCCRGHISQTRRGAEDRRAAARDMYEVSRPDSLDGRHVLVVDDVLTTGATMTACLEAIHAVAPRATLSFLTLAATRMR